MAGIANRRLTKELAGLKAGTAAGITLLDAEDLQTWMLSVEVLGESIYKVSCLISDGFPGRFFDLSLVYDIIKGEVFALRFKFGPRYRMSASPLSQ